VRGLLGDDGLLLALALLGMLTMLALLVAGAVGTELKDLGARLVLVVDLQLVRNRELLCSVV
jgi:hypothetical protein